MSTPRKQESLIFCVLWASLIHQFNNKSQHKLMTIYKYPLKGMDVQTLKLPECSEILTVQAQRDEIYLWAAIEESITDTEDRIIELFHTDTNLMKDLPRKYIGTVQLHGGSLVAHA